LTFDGANLVVGGNITGSYILGNGSQLTGLAATYGNANVAANLAALGTNPVSTTGNITGGNLLTSGILQFSGGSRLRPTGANLDIFAGTGSYVQLVNSNESSSMGVDSAGGYIVTPGGSWGFSTTGTFSAPGNFSAVGAIQTGSNITGGNVLTGGLISATGNITGNYFIGNGSQLTGITANTGNVTFRDEIVIGTGTSNLISGLYLAPSSSSANVNMYLRVRGNITDEPTHIHFDTGNNQYYNQFIGDDNKYIQLANTGNIVVNSNDGVGNSAQWIFGSNSKITLPNGATIRDTSGDSVVFGQNAGLTSQAQHAVAIGINAGRLYQGEDSVAIGYNAGYYDQGRGVAIGWNAGEGGVLFRSVSDAQGGSGPVTTYNPVQAPNVNRLYVTSTTNIVTNQLVFGNNIQANTLVTAVYPGEDRVDIAPPYTAAMSPGDTLTFVGLTLGINDASNIVLYMRVIGTNIPENTFVQSTGCSTVTLNNTPTAPLVNGASITFNVGQGFGATAVGYRAGENFQDANAVAVGSQAGYDNQGVAAVAVGYLAGYANQGNAAVAMGWSAGQTTQGTAAVAIGEDAGRTNQGEYSVAIGYQAGYSGQGNNSIVLNATGDQINGITANTFTVTPVRNDVANTANVMFYNASSKEITYGDVISVAGNITGGNVSTGVITLTNGAVIKDNAGDSVAFGQDAGLTTQGTAAVAIGTGAGYSGQGNSAVAIGGTAGATNQGVNSVAIGAAAGAAGNSAVAIGVSSGFSNQGNFAVAIGASAGATNQGNNSIILNATGAALDQTTANTFTVAPVRNDVANTANIMFYNATSKEITYGNVINVAGNITGGNVLFGSGIVSGTGNITGGNLTISGNTATITTANYSIGYLNIPQISLAANTTTALTDSGKHYYSVSASNLALTIANNTSVSWPIGTAISIVNRGTANIIIAGGTGVSVYLAGNAIAGNRVVTTYGMATVMNVAANIWMINGTVS
jgi:hypothetical protein